MNIVCPALLALDSSHLGKLADNARSSRESLRGIAAGFLKSLTERGRIILLSWHHFEEVLGHGNSDIVKERIAFFQSLPFVAWIASFQDKDCVGSIVDVLAFEVAEAFTHPEAGPIAIRDRVRQKLFRYGTGRQAIEPFISLLHRMPEKFRRRQERTREIVSILYSRYNDMRKTKVTDLLKGQLRSKGDVETQLASMAQLLAKDIHLRGDGRISDPENVARRFMDDVHTIGQVALANKHSPDALLPEEIDPSDIGPETTLEEIGDLVTFRRRLRLVNSYLGLPWPDLKAAVAEDRIPSSIIQTALRRSRQDLRRREGGELIDQYLACLAP